MAKPITDRCRIVYSCIPNDQPFKAYISDTQELTGHSKKSVYKSLRALESNGWIWIESNGVRYKQIKKRRSLSGISIPDEFQEGSSWKVGEVNQYEDYPNQQICRFKLANCVTEEDLLNAGFRWVEGNTYYICKPLENQSSWLSPITVNITVHLGEPSTDWYDIKDVDVIDDNILQPYVPFYDVLKVQIEGREIEQFPKLKEIIINYNRIMSSFRFLHRVVV